MAEDIEKASGEPAAKPDNTPKAVDAKSELPMVESPSISPAEPEPVVEPLLEAKLETKLEPKLEIPPPLETAIPFESDSPIAPTPASPTRLRLAARHRRTALLAASVVIAAALGAVLGAVASGGFATPTAAPVDVASLEERKAMQQSIAHLSKEIITLKSSVEAANKTAHTQIAKMSDKISDKLNEKINDKVNEKIAERLSRERAEITGSISAPQTVPAASTPAPAPQVAAPQVTAPLPPPRPPQRVAAVENPQPPIIPGWSVRMARDGYALVEGHGDIYQVVPGVPVPGLGTVQQIKRQDGRWVVVTPRGIVVSMRGRRYFDPY